MMNDATGLAEAHLGLGGFRMLDVTETLDEVAIMVGTPSEVIVTVENGGELRRLSDARGALQGQEPCESRHQGPALLQASGPPG